MSFTVKSISPRLTLGQGLRKTRESWGWTLEKAARVTHIQPRYLAAIEDERWSDLPEEPARNHFTKRYIRILGNNPQFIVLTLDSNVAAVVSRATSRPPKTRASVSITPRRIKFVGIGLVFSGLLVYLGLQINALISPPLLTILSPDDGLSSALPSVIVRGSTEDSATITVNDRPVLKTPRGTFEETVHLERGVNLITIAASKRYSKPRTLYRSVIFEKDSLSINN